MHVGEEQLLAVTVRAFDVDRLSGLTEELRLSPAQPAGEVVVQVAVQAATRAGAGGVIDPAPGGAAAAEPLGGARHSPGIAVPAAPGSLRGVLVAARAEPLGPMGVAPLE